MPTPCTNAVRSVEYYDASREAWSCRNGKGEDFHNDCIRPDWSRILVGDFKFRQFGGHLDVRIYHVAAVVVVAVSFESDSEL